MPEIPVREGICPRHGEQVFGPPEPTKPTRIIFGSTEFAIPPVFQMPCGCIWRWQESEVANA